MATTPTPTPAVATVVTKTTTASFLDSLGVNIHTNYTDGGYKNAANILADINYLGIYHARDNVPNINGGLPYVHGRQSMEMLMGAGVQFDMAFASKRDIQEQIDMVKSLKATHPDSIVAVEGPNEINNFPVTYQGLTGETAALNYQRDLYSMVHADSALSGIPVYFLTGASQQSTIAGLGNFANDHPYTHFGNQPNASIRAYFVKDYSIPEPYPKVSTECGYFNNPTHTSNSGVDDATQAKLTLNMLLDATYLNVDRTYIYQLLSAYPDLSHTNADVELGLFNQDNSPKPVATAIHNLTTIINHANGLHAREGLSYTLTGAPTTTYSMLIKGAGTTSFIALWDERDIWNQVTHAPIPVANLNINVSWGAVRTGAVYRPYSSANPIQTITAASAANVTLNDSPLIIELHT
jgi:hypothetical protein